jgi:hypothetical protein
MTIDMSSSIKASRFRVPRSRGALSGFLLLVLGAWAALAPMIGPYFDVSYTPAPDDAWHWTAARGWLEVLPGSVVFLGGLLLMISTSRVMTIFGGWLAAAGGAWLIVGPPLADAMNISLGRPDPVAGTRHQAFDAVVLFYGVGALILFFAATSLGRLSVVSVRDIQAAERRAAAEDADVSALTHYPPAPPMREPTDPEAAEAGRHRGGDQWREDDDQPTTAIGQPPLWGEQGAPAGPPNYPPGQQPNYPPGQQPNYPPGQNYPPGEQPTYAQSGLPRREED